MRLCYCFQSLCWASCQDSDTDVDWGRGELCRVCVKDQTGQGPDSSKEDTQFLSGCCQLVLLCSGVKLYRLKTSGFSPAVCTQKESSVSRSIFTKFLSGTFSWPWYDKLGQFLRMNRVSSCATFLFDPSPAFGRIWVLKFGAMPLLGAFKCNVRSVAISESTNVICIEVKHNVSCRGVLNYEAAKQSHVTRRQQVSGRWLVTYGC